MDDGYDTPASLVLSEYQKFLFLAKTYGGVVPSHAVDKLWHNHILDTTLCVADSQAIFGRYLHHQPSYGDIAGDANRLASLKDAMMVHYRAHFGEPPAGVWVSGGDLHVDRCMCCDGTPPCDHSCSQNTCTTRG